MATQLVWTSVGEDSTFELGYRIGSLAEAGLVVALIGDLGSGKTCLAQGIARGLGVPESVPVTSPTFTLINPYMGRLPLYHLDLYRVSDFEELEVLGVRDLFGPGNVTVIEWADRFEEALPGTMLKVVFSMVGADTRRVEIESVGKGGDVEGLLTRLAVFLEEKAVGGAM